MDIPKNGSEQAAISLAPLETDMTMDDFLESELEIYEYMEGKLVPIPPTPVEHGNISMNLSLSLGQHSACTGKSIGTHLCALYRFQDRWLCANTRYCFCFLSPDTR